ncbi:MAG TPA: TetR/AcrR family transcriptional regulator, partial [Acidothermaceae bacterium]|nr:TetR/AcrR family transcriptional regulator [Acidothermaceae bacterium]
MATDSVPGSGRKAQAARNDQTIVDAARTVFLRDPSAPISAVAAEAGVGISALYRRYASKDDLLRSVCEEGLHRFIAIAEAALEHDDPWESLVEFITGVVQADVHSITVRLAGTFTPSDELHQLSDHANQLAGRLFRRARAAGAVRQDLHVNDLPMLFEQLASIHGYDDARTRALRDRYLSLQLDALRPA